MKNLVALVAGTVLSTAALAHDNCAGCKVVADASTRESSPFTIQNNGFSLNVGLDAQFRYTSNFENGSNYEGGFSNQMTRLRFEAVAHDWKFNLSAAFRDNDFGGAGFARLEDAFVSTNVDEQNTFGFGQFKTGFLQEVNIDDRYQIAASRSIVSNIFGQDRSQGIVWTHNPNDRLSISVAATDGFNTDNTGYVNPVESDYAITGRANLVLQGNMNEFSQFSAGKNTESSAMVGVAGHYQDGDIYDMYSYTADATYKVHGLSVFGSAVGRNISIESGSQEDYNDFGFVGQASYRVTEKDEIFGRWETILGDEDRFSNGNDFSFLTAGYSRYICGNNAKVTADVIYAFDNTENLDNLGSFSNSTGLLGSDEEGEIGVRVQFQLSF